MINIFLSIVFMAALFQNVRCTAVGFTAGAFIDGSKPDEEMVPREQWSQIRQGEDISVVRSDGSVVSGSAISADTPMSQATSGSDSLGVLYLRASGQDVTIPHAGIQTITAFPSHHAKWYGMLIGLGVDVAILVGLAAAYQNMGESF